MKLFKSLILALFLFYSLPSEVGAFTPFQDHCWKGNRDYGIRYARSWPSYLRLIQYFASTGRNTVYASADNRPEFPAFEICMIRNLATPSARIVQCGYANCPGAPSGNIVIKSFDGTTFKTVDDRWIDIAGNIIEPDCILKPINIYFPNGVLNNRRDTRRSLNKIKSKVYEQLAKQNITNDSAENPSCSDITFTPFYYNHSIEDIVTNTLETGARPVEDYTDPDAFKQSYSEVVTTPINPETITEQIAAMDSRRGGQKVTSLIIAHSRGNKVANKIYELSTSANKPGIIALATPESFVADGSDHITTTNDTVITEWVPFVYGVVGHPQPLPGNIPNTNIPFALQHSVEDYLKPGSAARQAICDRLKGEFAKPGFVGAIP